MDAQAVTPDPAGVDEAHETKVANDLVKRGLLVLPVFILIGGLAEGVGGAVSAALGVGVVLLNFTIAARGIAWAAPRGSSVLAGTVLGGYILRLCIVVAVFLAFRGESWFAPVVFGVTLLVTHLGLLFWETRYVELTLGAPGLRPAPLTSPSTHVQGDRP